MQKNYSWNPSKCVCENSKYLKRYLVTKCDEIVIVMDNLSTKMTNTIATNVTSTASINWRSKKHKKLLYFAYSVISDQIIIDNYYYLLSLCKTKSTCYYFDDII